MSSTAKVEDLPIRNQELPSSTTRRPQLLEHQVRATETRSYRSFSPSRFLDYPLAVNPAIYTYTRVRRERDRAKEREKAREKRERQKETEDTQELEDIDDDLEIDKPKPTQPGFHPSSTPYESVPGKERVDYYLDAIAQLYYRKKTPATSAITPAMAHQELDLFPYPTLHTLMSPLRTPHPLDHWSAREVLLFEAAMTGAGKDFHTVQRVVGSKSHTEVVDMYYVWKKTAHYALWKQFGRQARHFHPFRLDCWAMAEQKMLGMTNRASLYTSPDAPPTSAAEAEADMPPRLASPFEFNALQLALGGPPATRPRYRRLLRLLRLAAAGKIPLGNAYTGNSRVNQALTRARRLRLLRAAASAEVVLAAEREKVAAARLRGEEVAGPGAGLRSPADVGETAAHGAASGHAQQEADGYLPPEASFGPNADKDARLARVQAQRREAHLRASAERVGMAVLADLEAERARQYHLALGACEEAAAAVQEVFHEREKAQEVARTAAAVAVSKLGLAPAAHARVSEVVASLALRRVWHERVNAESSAIEQAAREALLMREREKDDGAAVGMVTRGAGGRRPKRGAASLFEVEEPLPQPKRRRG